MFYYWLFCGYAFFFGASIASFLNVCIWRIPREESIVSPPSHCPKCNARIRWYQNIPIFSWLALRGRCANCREPISPRYIGVELLGGILFLCAFAQWANNPAGVFRSLYYPPLGMAMYHSFAMVPVTWLVFAGLILGSFVDIDHQWIPDRVTIGGMLLGVPLSCLVPELQREAAWTGALVWSLVGLAFGFGLLWLVGEVFSRIFKKDAMGFGDVKLMGAIGAFFGPAAVVFCLIVSSLLGSVIGIAMILRGRAKFGGYTAIPYGPYIALSAVLWTFWGHGLISWYMALLRPGP